MMPTLMTSFAHRGDNSFDIVPTFWSLLCNNTQYIQRIPVALIHFSPKPLRKERRSLAVFLLIHDMPLFTCRRLEADHRNRDWVFTVGRSPQHILKSSISLVSS